MRWQTGTGKSRTCAIRPKHAQRHRMPVTPSGSVTRRHSVAITRRTQIENKLPVSSSSLSSTVRKKTAIQSGRVLGFPGHLPVCVCVDISDRIYGLRNAYTRKTLRSVVSGLARQSAFQHVHLSVSSAGAGGVMFLRDNAQICISINTLTHTHREHRTQTHTHTHRTQTV